MNNTYKKNNYPQFRMPALKKLCPICGQEFEARGLIPHIRMIHNLLEIKIPPKALKLSGKAENAMLLKFLKDSAANPQLRLKTDHDNKIKSLQIEGNLVKNFIDKSNPKKFEYHDEITPSENENRKAEMLSDFNKELVRDKLDKNLKPLIEWGVTVFKQVKVQNSYPLSRIKKQIKYYGLVKLAYKELLINPTLYDCFAPYLYGDFYSSKMKARELLKNL